MQSPHPRRPGQPFGPMQPLVGGLTLRRGRLHAVSGCARHGFAALLMGRTEGAVIWIGADPGSERVFPGGLQAFADPGRIVFAKAGGPADLAWSIEQALRSGAAPLVIADLADTPFAVTSAMTLAAEAGADAARGLGPAPLGLVLRPSDGGAGDSGAGDGGFDTRWRMTPMGSPGPDMAPPPAAPVGTLHWRLDRLHARDDPPASWPLTRSAAGLASLGPPMPI